jgi:hypothetical protein
MSSDSDIVLAVLCVVVAGGSLWILHSAQPRDPH